MFKLKLTRAFALAVLLAGFALTNHAFAQTGEEPRAPEIPAFCSISVPQGHQVAAHVYATGVQVYRWNGATWDFVGPVAKLFADANYQGVVGTHYAGPTWKSNGDSQVVGRRVNGCSVNPLAIDWLLLEAASTEGHGLFNRVTYIHRVNTAGGMRPTTPGATTGVEQRVPYTAEYFFYRAEN